MGKVITAYFVVQETMLTKDAVNDEAIIAKYHNPHISRTINEGVLYDNDVILFGDPIRSKILEIPLPFDRPLSSKLTLDIPFQENRSDNQCISSATRAWRELSAQDIKVLLESIKLLEERGISSKRILTTDEVLEIRERDLERFIIDNSGFLGKDMKVVGQQLEIGSGRIDLLLMNDDYDVVVELKLNEIGRAAINQLQAYMNEIKDQTGRKVKGVMVCKGIMPAFAEEITNIKNIDIYFYGWKLDLYNSFEQKRN
jgi:hypothetical protein